MLTPAWFGLGPAAVGILFAWYGWQCLVQKCWLYESWFRLFQYNARAFYLFRGIALGLVVVVAIASGYFLIQGDRESATAWGVVSLVGLIGVVTLPSSLQKTIRFYDQLSKRPVLIGYAFIVLGLLFVGWGVVILTGTIS